MRSLAIAAALSLAAIPGAAATVRVEAGSPGPGDVLLLVNDEPILKSTVDEIVKPMTRAKLAPEQLGRFRQQAVQSLVTDMLMSQFLREQKYTPSPSEVEKDIERRKGIYERSKQPGAPSFEESLRRRSASVEQMRRNPTARMRFSCYIRALMTERDVRRLFETERHAFDGTEVRSSHVLIDTRNLRTFEEKAAAREKAEDIARRAQEGEDFAELARKHSACPTSKKGGDLGFFPRRGKMVEPFAAAAFILREGEVSEVVETRFGFHVIKTTGVKPGRDVTLEDVRSEVVAVLADRRGREVFEELTRNARIETPVR